MHLHLVFMEDEPSVTEDLKAESYTFKMNVLLKQ